MGAAQLRGKIVVVGATAPALQDVHPTSAPGSQQMAGAEIQASAISTALEGNPLQALPGWVAFVIAVLMGALAGGAVRIQGPVRGSAIAVGACVLYALGAQLAFSRGAVLPVAVPLVTLAFTLAAALLARAVAERSARARVSAHRDELEAAVHARTKDLVETQLEVVLRLARAAELRDDDTGEHIDRMSRMCGDVALEIGLPPTRPTRSATRRSCTTWARSASPTTSCASQARLTIEEMAIMRRHVVEGSLLLEGSPSPVLQVAEIIVDTHHERWDGTGYPNGLKGEDIPLEGRIAAVCDVFDALTHERPYKHAWNVADACREIERLRGSHFDPAIADALLAVVRRRLKSVSSADEAGIEIRQ